MPNIDSTLHHTQLDKQDRQRIFKGPLYWEKEKICNKLAAKYELLENFKYQTLIENMKYQLSFIQKKKILEKKH